MDKEIKFILEDKDEINTIKNCLNYCVHRIREHDKDQAGDIKIIQKLRRDMGVIN